MSDSAFPIYIIGAGGIVNDAHLPAYKIAGYHVAGIYDLDVEKAKRLAEKFDIPTIFDDLVPLTAAAGNHCVYDIALPADAILQVLAILPRGSYVLIQKPPGNYIAVTKQIIAIAEANNLVIAVNFQMRYAPFTVVARELIAKGLLGEVCDIDININVYTPWHLWNFLYGLPRVEILYHSIHYIDLVRSFFGDPLSVYAKTTKHPSMPQLASVRSNIIMDYGEMVRANIVTNHCHKFGLQKQHAYIKIEGTQGAINITPGVLMNYPEGVPASLEYVSLVKTETPEWKKVALNGNWFPHAFIGSMAQVMQAKAGLIHKPDNSIDDALHTMACLEAAYASSQQGGVSPIDFLQA